jgi:hypothetical protein
MRLEVNIDSKLPMVCARSGSEADVVVVHELIDSPVWSWLAFAFGPLVGVVAQLATSEVRRVRIPTSQRLARRYFLVARLTALLLIVPIFIVPFSPGAAAALLIVLFGIRVLSLRTLWVSPRLRGDRISIAGVHERFADAVADLAQKSPDNAGGSELTV